MNKQEYKDSIFGFYSRQAERSGCGGPILFACLIGMLFLLCGCKTQYVPVETIRTEIVHQHDTIKQTDSIKTEKETIIREARPEDSVMIAKLGIKLQNNERLLILLQKELSEAKNNMLEIRQKDSVRSYTIQVPYPVPAQLSRWQSFCCDYGKLMLGVSITFVLLTIFFLIKYIKAR